jgi:starch synthase
LRRIGVDAFLVTPCHLQTDASHLWGVAFESLTVGWMGSTTEARIFYSEANGAPTYLIDAPGIFHRDSVYGAPDDHLRFAFFCRAALTLLERLGAPVDVVHLNDWHCGFAAVELASRRRNETFWTRSRTVFSIHNLAYQGVFGVSELGSMGFGSDAASDAFALEGAASALKAALEVADVLSTVSRTYAREIQTKEHGGGLDWLLRSRSDRLFGIVNGIDFETWNPETDAEITAPFDATDLSGKALCKKALLAHFGLDEGGDRPVLASITRLTAQKGIDLILAAADEIVGTGARIVSLGSGDSKYEDALQRLRDRHPDRVGIYRGYNERLSHLIEAGADMFLMPSKFEPCGLNQMYSLRYGTVPIVRAVGGLDDTVEEFSAATGKGNGFKFEEYRADRFLEKVFEALYRFQDKESWHRMQVNGMSVDNSWERAAKQYVELYRSALSV